MNLATQGESVFEEALMTPGLDASPNVRSALQRGLQRLGEPMRVAVLGQIKAGKSTLINALLGQDIVATGQLELTFNVCELHYATDPSIVVHFKDGRPTESRQPEELESLTARNAENQEYLSSILRIEMRLPAELLRSFSLVDTPGLNSVYGTDSENTLRYLGRTKQEVEDASASEMNSAGAIIYLFSKGLGETDASLLKELRGPMTETASPLTAIGVLSRCDRYWKTNDRVEDRIDSDPLVVGRKIADGYLAIPEIRSIFYNVYPVIGILGIGASKLDRNEIEWLTELASETDRLTLARRLHDVNRFVSRTEDGLPLDREQRLRLVRRLDGYGIHRACDFISQNTNCTDHELRTQLFEASGLSGLRDLVLGHFGNRSVILRLERSTRETLGAVMDETRASRMVPDHLRTIGHRIERLQQREHVFRELNELGALYRDELAFSAEEVEQVLAVTGERGLACWHRLGQPDELPLEELEQIARNRVGEWSRRANDTDLDRATSRAAKVILRSFEGVLERVVAVRQVLSWDKRLIEDGQ